jgi:predicted GNAT family acetyltransferase
MKTAETSNSKNIDKSQMSPRHLVTNSPLFPTTLASLRSSFLIFLPLPIVVSFLLAAPAVIDYAIVKDNVIDLYHTEVPPEFQGKGIAKVLAIVSQ